MSDIPAAILAAKLARHDGPGAGSAGIEMEVRSDFEQVVADHIDRHHGRVLDAADKASFPATFPSAVEAVACAVELQRDLAERGERVPASRQVRCRIGVDYVAPTGEVSMCDEGANVVRLAALAEPGGVCMSRAVYDEVKSQLKLRYDTNRDPAHSAFTCGDIRRKRNDLNLLEASAVRIGEAALMDEPGTVGSSRALVKGARDLVHKFTSVLAR